MNARSHCYLVKKIARLLEEITPKFGNIPHSTHLLTKEGTISWYTRFRLNTSLSIPYVLEKEKEIILSGEPCLTKSARGEGFTTRELGFLGCSKLGVSGSCT